MPLFSTCRFISQLPLQAVSTGGILCDNIPGLIGKQRRMCRSHQNAMFSIRKGAKEGVKECQFQFRKHRWNCSTLDRDASVFGKVLLKGNSFVTNSKIQICVFTTITITTTTTTTTLEVVVVVVVAVIVMVYILYHHRQNILTNKKKTAEQIF